MALHGRREPPRIHRRPTAISYRPPSTSHVKFLEYLQVYLPASTFAFTWLVTARAPQSWGVAFIKIRCSGLVLCAGDPPGPADLASSQGSSDSLGRRGLGGRRVVWAEEGGVEVSKHGVKIATADQVTCDTSRFL